MNSEIRYLLSVDPVIRFVRSDEPDIGNLHKQILRREYPVARPVRTHALASLATPAAINSVLRAISACSRSTMRPLIWITPLS
jgi:hypothetical protein